MTEEELEKLLLLQIMNKEELEELFGKGVIIYRSSNHKNSIKKDDKKK